MMYDIAGQIFGRLTAIKIVGKDKRNEYLWLCKCSCGNEKIVRSSALRIGQTKSCGCLNRELSSDRRAKCNENYFSVPNIENSYWAGFIAADGSIFVPKKLEWQRRLHLGVSEVDLSHLERFVYDIEFSGNICKFIPKKSTKNTTFTSIQITSNKICYDLKNNFNIVPKKSLILKPPNIEDTNFILSFIKGYIDGDGCIGNYRNSSRINIVGTSAMLSWIKMKIENSLNLRLGVISKEKDKNLFYFYICGRNCRIVAESMMKIKTPYLARKWGKIFEDRQRRKFPIEWEPII